MAPRAFVYTELQISIPFSEAPWQEVNLSLLSQPGLLSKTWLAGVTNHSLGGLYAFDGLNEAQTFVTGYFPAAARQLGAPQTTRVFDAQVVREAGIDMGSPYFGATPTTAPPGAFVYTEAQVSISFAQAPWRDFNSRLREYPGLLSKTWLSGLNTQTLGGFYAFETIDSASDFALNEFPSMTAQMNAAFYCRVFDGESVAEASRALASPFFR